MNIFKKIVGKSIIDDLVVIMNFSHSGDSSLSRIFENRKEAEAFYDSIKLGDTDPIGSLKTKFCNHENTFNARISRKSETHYYKCCTDCGNAVFVNDETQEEHEARLEQAELRMMKARINQMKDEIEQKQGRLRDMEIVYNSKKMIAANSKLNGGSSLED